MLSVVASVTFCSTKTHDSGLGPPHCRPANTWLGVGQKYLQQTQRSDSTRPYSATRKLTAEKTAVDDSARLSALPRTCLYGLPTESDRG